MKSNLMLTTAMAAVLIVAGKAGAQTTSDEGKRSDASVETVIVTGKKLPEDKVPMKVTFTQSTISQEQILNASPGPTTSIQTLLNSEPSILATTSGPNGMETDIKFRSFVDGEFGETVAGVPLNDVFNSGVTYQADNRNNNLFIVRDLEGVDIYRGVNNPSVNTYNSLGGTINYRPRQPTDDMNGDVGVDGGSFDTFNYHATFNTGDIDGIKQTISFERDYSSGWLKNDPDWNDNIYYANKADLGSHTEVYSYFVYNKNKGDAPQDIPVNLLREFGDSYQYSPDIYRSVNDDQNFLGIAGFKSEITDFITIEDEVYGGDNNYQRVSYSNPAYKYGANPAFPYYLDDQAAGFAFWTSYMGYNPNTVFGSSNLGTDYHFYGYNGALYGDRFHATIDLPFNKITAGGDFNLGELHSREYWYGSFQMPKIPGYNDAWDEHDTRQIWSAFVQDDIHLWDDRIHITPGLKYIGSAVKDNDTVGFYYEPPGSIHSDEHFLSPTLGGSVEPLDNWTVYASFGKNVKFPDITALYGELGYTSSVPAVTVTPEYALDYEFGTRYKWDSLQLEVNAYRENFSHIIINTNPPALMGASQQTNGGAERYQGVEMQLTDDFGEVVVGNLKGYLNASYNEAVCTSNFPQLNFSGPADAGSCTKGQEIPNVPKYLLSSGLTWDYSGWHVDLVGRYVGTQQLSDYYTSQSLTLSDIEPGQPTKIPSYFLFNVGIVKVIPVDFGPANAVRLALHVDNLFDKHYYTDAETNSDNNNAGGLLDTYAIPGAPRAVYASVSVYF